MSGYIGSKSSVTQVDGYTRSEADAAFATAAQGGLADTAVQPNDNVTLGAVTASSFSGDGSALTGLSIPPSVTELVSSVDLSGVAQVDFTDLDFQTYNYKVYLSGGASTDNSTLTMGYSNDNLSSFRGYATIASGIGNYVLDGGVHSIIDLFQNYYGTSAFTYTSFVYKIDTVFATTSGSILTNIVYSFDDAETSFMNSIRFFFLSSYTFDAGTLSLYRTLK